MNACRRLVASMFVCSVISASVGCTSVKTLRPISPRGEETRFRDLKAPDTVSARLRAGRIAVSVIPQVAADTVIAPAAAEAAPRARANAVYVELLGNGGVYSVNYERALTPAVRVRVGAASWTTESVWSDAEIRIQTFPMMLHVVSGGGAHHLETGIGVLPGQRRRDRDVGVSGGFVSLIGSVGYRYEPPPRRFVFRAGFTPFYGFGQPSIAYPEEGFMPSLGFSFGARF